MMPRTVLEMAPRLLVAVVLTAGIVTAAYDKSPMQVPPPGPNSNPGGNGNSTGGGGVHVISWNYEYVKGPLLTSLFLMASGILKLGFHKMHLLSSLVPESCLLILVGVAFGGILEAIGESEVFQLHPRTFMLFLLPPIILDSAYSLVDRVFAENIGTILLFAVLGTIMSCFMLGPTLYGLAVGGGMTLDISFIECLLFASFIVAVDPVAVLAIFNEVGVNDTLYFLVFGESLLNDAVTVVLNNMMKAFVEMETIPPSQIGIGIASFFTISLGGLFIGIIFGVLTALLTRTTKDLRVIEPLAVLILAYLSYIVAELFHWSGIISAIGCGIVQAQYAFHNISRKSLITVNYFIKMTSSTCDCMIFLYLGIEVLRNKHEWNTGFVLWSTFYCLVFRFIVIFGLSVFVNMAKPTKKINLEEQFIMWYGGLRGAVCFALCDTLNPKFRHRNMFLTTTFFIIFMTVFVQGMTIKPLVKLCKVKRKDKNESVLLIEEINARNMDHVMTGVEVIIQQKGNFYFHNFLRNMNDHYLSRWLQNNPMTQDQQILQTYGNMLMTDYERNIKKKYVYVEEPEGWSHFYTDPLDESFVKPPPVVSEPSDGILRKRQGSRASSRASSIRRSITGKRTMENEVEPTCKDVASILKRASVTATMFHMYDPNLKNDDALDIAAQLAERHRRVERANRASRRSAMLGDGHGSRTHLYSKHGAHSYRPPFTTQHSIGENGRGTDCASVSSLGSSQADKNANITYHPDGHHPHSNGSHDMSRDRSTSRDRPSISPHPDGHRAYSMGSHGSPRDRTSPRGQLSKSRSESHATTSRDRPKSPTESRDQRASVTESIESETNV